MQTTAQCSKKDKNNYKGEPMNKPLIAGLVGIVLVATLLLGVHAYGQQFQQNQNSLTIGTREMHRSQQGTCEFHDQMQDIMVTGTYADLVALREESGKPMMPQVTDETSFAAMQEQHKQMVADGTAGSGCPMRKGQGLGKTQGHNCPMMNN